MERMRLSDSRKNEERDWSKVRKGEGCENRLIQRGEEAVLNVREAEREEERLMIDWVDRRSS